MSTYIKLYRKILDNPELSNDNNAFIMFTKLLLKVDRKTGMYTAGRKQLAQLCNLKNATAYRTLCRLADAGLVATKSNTKYTTITVVSWHEYQSSVSASEQLGSNITTHNETKESTKQEKKEKENIDTNVSMVKAKTPSVEINELLEYWETTVGFAITGQKQKNRYACSNLIKSHGLEKAMRLVDGVAQAGADRYAPRIADFVQLQQKQNELIAWGKKTIIASKPKGVVIR